MTQASTIKTSRKSSLAATLIGSLSAIGLGLAMIGAGNAAPAEKTAAKAVVGSAAPDFTLTDLDGNEHTLSDYTKDGQIVVLEWFSPTCPFVKKHYRDDTMTMNNLVKDFAGEDVVWLRINSANADRREGEVAFNKKAKSNWEITTPILMDNPGTVGKTYGAKRTPEMYIIDASGTLVYHGAIDNDSRAAKPGDVNYVQKGLSELVEGKSVSTSTTKAYGCSVKY